ncbi:MAG: hypothetical protein ACYSRR_06310, partial [Planctomycetota bacterium]
FFRFYIDGVFKGEFRGMEADNCMGQQQWFKFPITEGGKEYFMECYLRYRGLHACPTGLSFFDKFVCWIINRFRCHEIGMVVTVDGEVFYDTTVTEGKYRIFR